MGLNIFQISYLFFSNLRAIFGRSDAGVAQGPERRICNALVGGSNPSTGSNVLCILTVLSVLRDGFFEEHRFRQIRRRDARVAKGSRL